MTDKRPPIDGGGGPWVHRVPAGDDRERRVCETCDFVDYRNPKVVVGAVCWHGDRILLAKRAIEPRLGYWTIPAGFLEERESMAEGAAREVMEEARAEIEIESLLGFYEIPRISQIYVIYRARMVGDGHGPGPESLETALVHPADIPWAELAFPSVRWGLENAARDPTLPPLMAIHEG